MNISNRKVLAGWLAAVLLTIPACANMSDKENRMLTGAALGAAAGAVIDNGGAGGVLGGAAIGAAGGWLYDHYQKDDKGGKD